MKCDLCKEKDCRKGKDCVAVKEETLQAYEKEDRLIIGSSIC